MTKDTVIELIQHLLNKTVEKGCSEAEAASALKKAQQLMLEHNLSIETVEATEINKTSWTKEEVWQGRGQQRELPFVATVIEKHFFVKVVFKKGYRGRNVRVELFGNTENVAAAKHIFIFLSRTYRDLWQEYRFSHYVQGHQSRVYYAGLTDGLCAKLKEERKVYVEQHKSQNALMVLNNQLTAALQDAYPNMQHMNNSPLRGSQSTYDSGVRHGKRIEIRKGVTGSQSERKLIQ